MQIYTAKADWNTQREQLQLLRHRVFVNEQNVPIEIEQDGKDASASHYVALGETGQLLGCGRLLPDGEGGQIGRLAVLPEHRNKGVGRKLLDFIIADAAAMGMAEVFLLAQVRATKFYARAGFVQQGGQFLKAGILHQKMNRLLALKIESDADQRGQPVLNPAAIQDDPRVSAAAVFDSESIGRSTLYELLQSARRTLCIYSQLFDHALFDTESCETLLSVFARSHRESKVRVLIHDSEPMIKTGHRLQALSQRLSSSFEIRRARPAYCLLRLSFSIADGRGIWVLPDYETYAGYADLYRPAAAERLLSQFNWCWDHSQPDPELRLLDL